MENAPKQPTSLVTFSYLTNKINHTINKWITTYRKCIPAFERKHKDYQYRVHFTRTFVMLTHLCTDEHDNDASPLALLRIPSATVNCLPVGETTARSQCGGAQGKLTRAHSPPFHAATISVIAGAVASSPRPIPWVDGLLSRSTLYTQLEGWISPAVSASAVRAYACCVACRFVSVNPSVFSARLFCLRFSKCRGSLMI